MINGKFEKGKGARIVVTNHLCNKQESHIHREPPSSPLPPKGARREANVEAWKGAPFEPPSTEGGSKGSKYGGLEHSKNFQHRTTK
jgi:hypothetical protein